MSDKETTRNETPWRARGFKKPFQGTKYQEFIDANKSNVLKLNLRQRELQCGKYATKSVDMTAASAVDLTNVPDDWKTVWSPAMKGAASVLLQAERKRDLIHAGKSAHQITEDAATTIKWFFSLMTGLRRLVKSSDVMTGYLAGNQDVDVYVEKQP